MRRAGAELAGSGDGSLGAVGAGAVLRQAQRLRASDVPGEQWEEAGGNFPLVRLILDYCTVFCCLCLKEKCSK